VKTWHQAQQICTHENSTLVIPEHFNELDFFRKNLVKILLSRSALNGLSFMKIFSHQTTLCCNQIGNIHFGLVFTNPITNSNRRGFPLEFSNIFSVSWAHGCIYLILDSLEIMSLQSASNEAANGLQNIVWLLPLHLVFI